MNTHGNYFCSPRSPEVIFVKTLLATLGCSNVNLSFGAVEREDSLMREQSFCRCEFQCSDAGYLDIIQKELECEVYSEGNRGIIFLSHDNLIDIVRKKLKQIEPNLHIGWCSSRLYNPVEGYHSRFPTELKQTAGHDSDEETAYYDLVEEKYCKAGVAATVFIHEWGSIGFQFKIMEPEKFVHAIPSIAEEIKRRRRTAFCMGRKSSESGPTSFFGSAIPVAYHF